MATRQLSLNSRVISQDFDDAYAVATIIEQSNMIVSKRQKIITHYKDDVGHDWWVVKEIGKNSSDETLYIKVLYNDSEKPEDPILIASPYNEL